MKQGISYGTGKGRENGMRLSGIHSLTGQFTLINIVLVAGTVLLCWFLNTMFLGKIYEWNKRRVLTDTYTQVYEAGEQDGLDGDAFDIEFERLCANGNLTMIIITADGTIVRSSVNDNRTMLERFMDVLFDSATGEQISSGDGYTIQKRRDGRMDSEYLVMWGSLSDGKLVMARTPLDNIRESTSLSNKFLSLVGVVATLIGVLLSILVTKRITNPIRELSTLAQRMSDLDFEAKYHGNREHQNEIDLLGECMNELSGKLEHTISELKSANNELMLDNERKTQVDEMRREFLSNVSHELKTPLALIMGYAEGLSECINDDAQSREFYCEVIMDEADKMNRLVKKLLTLNRLEFGNQTVVMERFDITELIAGVVEASALVMEQEGITVNFDSGKPVFVWADEFEVEEVVTNYLSNAIHHAAGEKRIDIFYTQKEDCVRVSVFNTGNPIPEEEIDKIWIKFYKVDKARTREYGGSGIGLSIVKAIMDSFHRECGVCNREEGVEFWIELDTKNDDH